MQNKKSIWSTIILVATIISLALLIASIVFTAVGIPTAMEVAKQQAIASGADQQAVELAVGIAVGALIAALVISSIFDVLKIVGGFLFSLKGRWGIFCIVVAILSLAGAIGTIATSVQNKVGVGAIIIDSVTAAVNVVLVVACIMHYRENRA